MEPIVLMQQKWGLTFNIPWYLFLGGLSGGTLMIAALADLLGGTRERYQYVSRMSAYITIPAIVLGGLFLTLHLGKPERGFAFTVFFTNYNSWLTLGGWVLGAFGPVGVAYAAAWYFNFNRKIRITLALLGLPLGALMSLYTGFLLSAAWTVPGGRWFVPLWDNRFLPVLFVLSGLSTGLAACGLAVLAGRLWGRSSAEKSNEEVWAAAKVASLMDVLAILVEGTWVYLFLASLAVGTLGQQFAYNLVTGGVLAPWFWGGFVAIGLALPLLAGIIHTVWERYSHARLGWILYAEFLLVLIGGLVLRYVVVWGGDMKAPLNFPPSMIPNVPTIPPIAGLGG